MLYETIIRKYFTAWQKRDWDSVESLLADGFTFTSSYDDHIQGSDVFFGRPPES